LFGYPAMACFTPDVRMTPAERDCCTRMAHQCGSMNMSASHSCCQKVQRPSSMLTATTVKFVPVAASEPVTSGSFSELSLCQGLRSHQIHPPPESPPITTSILRI